MALPPPLDAPIHRELTSPPPVLPESDSGDNNNNNIGFGFEFPSFSFGGSMELMAVPKRKVPSHFSLLTSHFIFISMSNISIWVCWFEFLLSMVVFGILGFRIEV